MYIYVETKMLDLWERLFRMIILVLNICSLDLKFSVIYDMKYIWEAFLIKSNIHILFPLWRIGNLAEHSLRSCYFIWIQESKGC